MGLAFTKIPDQIAEIFESSEENHTLAFKA